jgi:hypothetical protein
MTTMTTMATAPTSNRGVEQTKLKGQRDETLTPISTAPGEDAVIEVLGEPRLLAIVAPVQMEGDDDMPASSAWEYYGEPEPFEIAAAETMFFPIADLALERFGALPAFDTHIQIVPLAPSCKRPAKGFLPSQHGVPKSREVLAAIAPTYADNNVGISSRRAVGALIIVDCDEPGVVERYQRETGREWPPTYATQTRPQSAPWKIHFYFMSTERSVLRIPRQVTNVTRQCGYDLKGNGGGCGGYVRAEGSVRDGEAVTVLHDVPIAPMPDDLADWIADDVAKARRVKRAQQAKERKVQQKAAPASVPAAATPRPFAVACDDRHWTIKSRIRSMKNLGMTDEQIMPVLLDHIRRYVEDGERLVANPAYVGKLRAAARKVPTLGEVSYRILTRRRRNRRQRRSTIPLPELRERFASCPLDIAPAQARQFFSVKNRADHQRLLREFRRHGYLYVGSQGSHSGTWSRPTLSLGLSPSAAATSTPKKPSSSWIESHTAHAALPHHREVCMRTESTQDQEVAGVSLIHTRMIEIPGRTAAATAPETRSGPEAA